MGAWGAGSFDNDTALDWYAEFRSAGSAHVAETLSAVETADYVDADEGSAALAAAEIVAATFGRPMAEAPSDLDDLLSRYRDFIKDLPDVRSRAVTAAKRVLADSSELRELWEESGDESAREWTTLVDDLITRLKAAE